MSDKKSPPPPPPPARSPEFSEPPTPVKHRDDIAVGVHNHRPPPPPPKDKA